MIARYELPEAQIHLLSMSSGTIYRCNDGEQRFLLVFFSFKIAPFIKSGFCKNIEPLFWENVSTSAILFSSVTQTDEKVLIRGCQAVRVQKREAI